MAFVKLDTGILDSSLWVEAAETRIVFITVLAMCGPDGLCEATAPGIARRANLPLAKVRAALARLEAPDTESRSLADEGRRLRRVDGGYFVTNYTRYREKDHTAAERKRRSRARQRPGVTRDNCDGHSQTVTVTQAEAEAEADVLTTTERARADARALPLWERISGLPDAKVTTARDGRAEARFPCPACERVGQEGTAHATRQPSGRLLIACFGRDGAKADCTAVEIAKALGYTARALEAP